MAYLRKHTIVHQYSVCEMERQLKLYDYDATAKNSSQVPVPLLPDIEQRRLHQIREIYYQQRECLSAYQFVQHQSTDDKNKK